MPVQRCFSKALVIWTVKLKLWACGVTNLSEFLTCCKSQKHFTRLFHVKLYKQENGDSGEIVETCCYWQVCERSGAKPKAIKSSVREHAKHDGKLQQWGEQRSRPVSLFITHPPPPLGFCFKTDTHSPKHPSSAFHTPVWSKQAAEEQQFQGPHSLSRRNSRTDKQHRDNPTEFSLISLVSLPVRDSEHTGETATQPA